MILIIFDREGESAKTSEKQALTTLENPNSSEVAVTVVIEKPSFLTLNKEGKATTTTASYHTESESALWSDGQTQFTDTVNSLLSSVHLERTWGCATVHTMLEFTDKEERREQALDFLSTLGVSYYVDRLFLLWRILICCRKQPNLTSDQCHTRPVYPTKSIQVLVMFWTVTEIPST